jgi:glycosidase
MDLRELLHVYFPLAFPIAREGWDRFGIGNLLATQAPFSDENARYTVRRLADAYNGRPQPTGATPAPVRAEEFLALGILTDALRYVCLHFGLRQRPGVLGDSFAWARQRLGPDSIDRFPPTFAALFPPRDVLLARKAADAWLRDGERDLSATDRVVVESILLYLQMRNPATRLLRDLFDDTDLQKRASYVPFVVSIEEFFDSQEPSGLTGQTLFHTLRAPILASPDSLEGQLAFIREHWAGILPPEILARLELTRDLLREMDLHRAPVYGPPPVPVFDRNQDTIWAEPAAFSRDADWMSNVVLIAKSTYVWLDQLSKRYGRPIRTLVDVPDAELDRLAAWGFTGLWLIGLWERSPASARIKQYMGNPEAVASAYSLADYRIADDLGGDAAYHDLKERAWRRGLRLASDMVPNHMGIDSRWVVEHPDWFLQSPRPPFPVYRFTGGDLCADSRAEVRIEEGYWNHTDAAVVFERRDPHSGDTRYLYHGNDGTSMPWNDTAQLDFTRADVREAVIQTILHVARMFPVIRFDAAMTLARKHYQRLWFPAPGDAGAIPSRAEHGMSREAFLAHMPKEFWREVVDRVAAEVPDTLLLAEAFWLMEGYFVRTLGMHRVYNSAFMNMLKMEENAKYRQTIKNVLEFSPEVLNRFVNFMNNPDERTALEQFGKGDKYFGVAVMMVTMPGLPMFGHGQIEGFAEKYGMEYRRAYWDEPVDEDMVRRHERDVFPLMRHRGLFSGAQHFALYDFVTPDGRVDENVFAYSNRHGHERGVILYNNAYEPTTGRLHTSSAINAAAADQDPYLVRRSLAEALALNAEPGVFYAFSDPVAGCEYLRSGEQLAREGLHADLRGYQYQVLVNFRELHDHDGRWHRLHGQLGGRPTTSLTRELRAIALTEVLGRLAGANVPAAIEGLRRGTPADLDATTAALTAALTAAREIATPATAAAPSPADVLAVLVALSRAPALPSPTRNEALGLTAELIADALPLGLFAHQVAWLGDLFGPEDSPHDKNLEPRPTARPPRRLSDMDLELLWQRGAGGVGSSLQDAATRETAPELADLLVRHPHLLDAAGEDVAWAALFADQAGRAYLLSNCFDDVWYFSRERFELLGRHALLAALRQVDAPDPAATAARLFAAAAGSGYREQTFLRTITAPVRTSPPVLPTPIVRAGDDAGRLP